LIVEVDQSIKVEQTNRDTVIAFSNGERFALLIPAVVKRQASRYLTRQGKSNKRIYLFLFVLSLYHLLRAHGEKVSVLVIDIEYDGQEQNIKALLFQFLAADKENRPKVVFKSIGKKSGAHDLAISVVRGERKANSTITFAEFVKPLAKKVQKNERGSPKT
jgi:hypothetical protein